MYNIPYHVYTHVIMINGYVVSVGSADKFCFVTFDFAWGCRKQLYWTTD